MASTAKSAAPAKSRLNGPGSGVLTGGGGGGGGDGGLVPLIGGTPGPRNGGSNGVDGVPEPPGAGPTEDGTGAAAPGTPGKSSLPSPGSSSAISGGTNSGVSNASLSGSLIATGFTATGESRLPQRTRARFSPSEITVSPAGIIMRFLVQ